MMPAIKNLDFFLYKKSIVNLFNLIYDYMLT